MADTLIDFVQKYHPITLALPDLTDKQFLRFCKEHEGLRIETNSQGEVEIMPPMATETSGQNVEVVCQLYPWAKLDDRGQSFESSAMFILPNGARRSPDACWVSKRAISTVPAAKRQGFWPLCPEFVIELRSPSDRRKPIEAKLREYMDNGAQLGWLLDPKDHSVTIYRPDGSTERVRKPKTVAGEGPVKGFVLDLVEVWG